MRTRCEGLEISTFRATNLPICHESCALGARLRRHGMGACKIMGLEFELTQSWQVVDC